MNYELQIKNDKGKKCIWLWFIDWLNKKSCQICAKETKSCRLASTEIIKITKKIHAKYRPEHSSQRYFRHLTGCNRPE